MRHPGYAYSTLPRLADLKNKMTWACCHVQQNTVPRKSGFTCKGKHQRGSALQALPPAGGVHTSALLRMATDALNHCPAKLREGGGGGAGLLIPGTFFATPLCVSQVNSSAPHLKDVQLAPLAFMEHQKNKYIYKSGTQDVEHTRAYAHTAEQAHTHTHGHRYGRAGARMHAQVHKYAPGLCKQCALVVLSQGTAVALSSPAHA